MLPETRNLAVLQLFVTVTVKFKFKFIEQERAKSYLQVAKTMTETINILFIICAERKR